MKKAVYIAGCFVIVLAGLGVDIYFLVKGIEEIVRGATSSPISGHDIAWGIVNIIIRDAVATILVYVLYVLWTLVCFGKQLRRARRDFW